MRAILVLNAKGGSGKTTVATNLAGYYTAEGAKVILTDYDPQGSSIDWLRQSHPLYLKAAEKGLSIFELSPSAAAVEREYWVPLLKWLASPRSMPQGCAALELNVRKSSHLQSEV